MIEISMKIMKMVIGDTDVFFWFYDKTRFKMTKYNWKELGRPGTGEVLNFKVSVNE